jgi:modulator of FtsH protease
MPKANFLELRKGEVRFEKGSLRRLPTEPHPFDPLRASTLLWLADKGAGQMNAWHDFFLAQAGAAGVLTGLVFVGVSINLQKIVSDPSSGLAGRAAEALILLVAVLLASVLVLVPAQGAGLLGAEVLVVGFAAWVWIVAIQLPRLREWGTMRADLRVSFVLRVVLGQVGTLATVIAGVAVLWVGPGGLYWLVAGTLFSIIAALAEAWVLLVEINR